MVCREMHSAMQMHQRRLQRTACARNSSSVLALTVFCLQARMLAPSHQALHQQLRVVLLELRQDVLHKLPAGTGQQGSSGELRRPGGGSGSGGGRNGQRHAGVAAPHRAPRLLPPKSQ